MYNTTQGLPVDHQQVHEWAKLQGLPNSFPFQPQVRFHQAIMPYAQLLAGLVALEAQNHAGRNPLRTFTYNLLTVNNFNNPNFVEMVQTAGELAEFYHLLQNKDLQISLRDGASFASSAGSSLMMDKYPDLKLYLTPEQIEGARQWIEHFRRVAQEINNIKESQNPNRPYPQQNVNQPNNSFNRQNGFPGAGNTPSPVSSPSASYMNGSFWDTSGHRSTSIGGDNFGVLMGGLISGTTEINPPDDIESVSMFSDSPKPFITRNPAVADFNKSSSKKTTSFGTPSTLPPPAPVVETDSRPWDNFKTETGAIIVPAALSTWKIDKTDDHPYAMAYNPQTHCLFHGKRPDGFIVEVQVPWEASNTMDYLKNEIRSDMKAAVPKDPHAPRVDPNYSLLTHMTSVTNNLLGYDTPLDPEILDTPPLEMELPVEIIFGTSLEDLQKVGMVEKQAIKDQLQGETDSDAGIVNCFEHYGDVTIYLPCNGTDVASVHAVINTANSMDQHVVDGVIKVISIDDAMSVPVREMIYKRLTGEINIGLKRNLQLTLGIEKVEEDYEDLLAAIKNIYGEAMLKTWLSHEKEMVNRALNVLSGDRLVKFLSIKHGENAPAVARRVLVFIDRVSLTQVDWSSTDMDIAFVDSGALSEASMPNLYRAVKAIFWRISVSDVPFSHVIIVTKDNVMLEFHKGWLNSEFFLISKR